MKPWLLACLTLMAIVPPAVQARPWVVAHRGGSRIAPENSMKAFKQAIELGVDAIEIDIHRSADGQLVVVHDDTIPFGSQARLRPVRELSWEQLRSSEIAPGETVPHLDQVLELTQKRCRLIIEIKHPHGSRYEGIESALVDTLQRHQRLADSVVISFDKQSLLELHKLRPELATGYLFGGTAPEPRAVQQELGVRYLGPHFKSVTSEWLKQAHQCGLKVNPWTVDDVNDLVRLSEMGCDALTTDRPDRLLNLLKGTSK